MRKISEFFTIVSQNTLVSKHHFFGKIFGCSKHLWSFVVIRNLNLFLGTKNEIKSLICNQIFKFHNELKYSEHVSEKVKISKFTTVLIHFLYMGKA